VFARALVGNELEKAKGDDTPQAAKSDADAALASPFGSRGATLLFCVMGIQASYLSWGGTYTYCGIDRAAARALARRRTRAYRRALRASPPLRRRHAQSCRSAS
jgi:hypothetical protein